jgi:glutaryl-CoA dehydrogenase
VNTATTDAMTTEPATPAPSQDTSASFLGPVDLIGMDGMFSEQEKGLALKVRALVDEVIRPNIADWYEKAVFPTEIIPELGKLGVLGMHLHGYGCAGRSAVEYGLAAQELEAGDSGLRTFVSVQGSLAMSAIHKHGSEEQKNQWLPAMAAGEAVGCFGLTEPGAGSDPASMTTTARQEPGGDWVLNGTKRWIGLATLADVAVIWAQTGEHGHGRGVRGFVVPTNTPGFTAEAIGQKLSMRASVQCEITLEDVRLPAEAILPADSAVGLKGPFQCLNEARYGIIWGVMGAARDSFNAVLDYTMGRTQFGTPLAGFQLTQAKLADMAVAIDKGYLLAHQIGRTKDADPKNLTPAMISTGKLDNCRVAIGIARDAREMLGGNGITLEHSPLRHANNLESVRTYEGTDEVHQLTIGRTLTGIGAFTRTEA